MESDDESEKVLNKLEEFHKHQKELAWQRKKKRNTEVDQLISQLADPKVAEKLRIYRLVEEQFDFIESEVEKEVKAGQENTKLEELITSKAVKQELLDNLVIRPNLGARRTIGGLGIH